jgi:GNAT superfamily N-acetyltransferase
VFGIHPVDVGSTQDYVDLVNDALGSDLTVDQLVAGDARAANARLLRERWLAAFEGKPIGAGALLSSRFSPADDLDAQIAVARSARGMGVGGALLSHLARNASDRGFVAVRGNVRDDDARSLAWAERRGGKRIHHRFESEVEVAKFDVAAHRKRLRRVARAGIVVRDMSEFGTEQDWSAYHQLFLLLLSDAPDMEGLPRWTLADAQSVLRDNPQSRPGWQVVACDASNRWLGMTVMTQLGHRAYLFFTGVDRSIRGRGLAGVLQGEAVLRATQAGFKTVFVNNLSTNAPMIAVNRRLGFVQQPGFWVLRRCLRPG